MNQNSDTIIGDILEINNDIVKNRIDYKGPKFIANIKEKHYRKRLDKLIKSFNKNKIILNKNNILELFLYLYTYNENTYPYVQDIKMSTGLNNSKLILSEMSVDLNDNNINDIKYIVNVPNNEELMNILIIIHYSNGTNLTESVKTPNLAVFDLETDIVFAISKLNESLVEVLELFLYRYLARFETNKGYMKKVTHGE